MKRFLSLVAALLLVFSLCGCNEEATFPEPTDKFFVNDFANVIDDTAETEFYAKAAKLSKLDDRPQVVIVTVNDLNGMAPSEYALELGRKWGVGDEKNNNGVIILLAVEDREIYISVGYGLEGRLPDSKTGRIIDVYGLEYLRQNRFSEGVIAISNAVLNEVYIEYGYQPDEGYVDVNYASTTQEKEPWVVIVSWIIMFIIIFGLSFFTRRRGIPFIFLPGGFHSGGFHSGGFKGGGFGGFKGGGGSFGGGGAGRGF